MTMTQTYTQEQKKSVIIKMMTVTAQQMKDLTCKMTMIIAEHAEIPAEATEPACKDSAIQANALDMQTQQEAVLMKDNTKEKITRYTNAKTRYGGDNCSAGKKNHPEEMTITAATLRATTGTLTAIMTTSAVET
jgi:hypothetical protein